MRWAGGLVTPARETPITGEILPGHSRFTLYFRYSYPGEGEEGGTLHVIEEIDIDADNEIDATALALKIFDEGYEPGYQLLAEHTARRYPGEMYF